MDRASGMFSDCCPEHESQDNLRQRMFATSQPASMDLRPGAEVSLEGGDEVNSDVFCIPPVKKKVFNKESSK